MQPIDPQVLIGSRAPDRVNISRRDGDMQTHPYPYTSTSFAKAGRASRAAEESVEDSYPGSTVVFRPNRKIRQELVVDLSREGVVNGLVRGYKGAVYDSSRRTPSFFLVDRGCLHNWTDLDMDREMILEMMKRVLYRPTKGR
ncbi:hypothetical protein KC357_g81 [Hortaea werneckii]|nr:hypothetical protein KC357_g81 [Hortaea werneckii]